MRRDHVRLIRFAQRKSVATGVGVKPSADLGFLQMAKLQPLKSAEAFTPTPALGANFLIPTVQSTYYDAAHEFEVAAAFAFSGTGFLHFQHIATDLWGEAI